MPTRTCYEIVIRGRASARVLWPLVDEFVITRCADRTRLIGQIRDPAHLHGLLAHLTAVNVELISVRPVDDSNDRP